MRSPLESRIGISPRNGSPRWLATRRLPKAAACTVAAASTPASARKPSRQIRIAPSLEEDALSLPSDRHFCNLDGI